MFFADTTSLEFQPATPWSMPGGVAMLGVVAIVLVALTLFTYLITRPAGFGQLILILGLRLFALAVAIFLLLRPTLAFHEENKTEPSQLIIFVDSSESMNISDVLSQSRWNHTRRLLLSPAVKLALKKLRDEQRLEVIYFQPNFTGSEKIKKLDPGSEADGPRTLLGTWINQIRSKARNMARLRGLLIFSDGADNDRDFVAAKEAGKFRELASIHTFGVGSPTTTIKHQDVAFRKITHQPQENVGVKNKLTVKGIVDAPGFANSPVQVSLYMQRLFPDGKQGPKKLAAPVKEFLLTKTEGNVVEMECTAPTQPGEIKVTLEIKKLADEVTDANNEISAYIPVTKEGISILWVEGRHRLESVYPVRYALSPEPRFNVYYFLKLPQKNPDPEKADWFNFSKQQYDIIVIGDITAERFSSGDRDVFRTIRKMVTEDGAGLLMLGGYQTFDNSDWQAYPEITDLLPVELNKRGQYENKTRVLPKPDGLRYLLDLGGDNEANEKIWTEVFDPLPGVAVIGTKKPRATVMAVRDDDTPVMIGWNAGAGRVLVFGGDETYKAWRRSEPAISAYNRFWRQVMLWLAQQETSQGKVYVKLQRREFSLTDGNPLKFTVGMLGKAGNNISEGEFDVNVIRAGKATVRKELRTSILGGDRQGELEKLDEPGEYLIQVTAKGKDIDGSEITGTDFQYFKATTIDEEALRPAANHTELKKIATFGGGEFRLADERNLLAYLDSLRNDHLATYRPDDAELWPQWTKNPGGNIICGILFMMCLCSEWFLRRYWGMV